MSLKEKILEQAKSEFRCEKCLKEIPSYQKKHFVNGHVCNGQVVEHRRVSVDVVCGLLDKAIMEIEKKAFRQGVGYWENAVMLADVQKILLGVVEAEKQK